MALTNHQAKIVLGMSARGDKKHDIAAWFGENQARIAEVEAGEFGNLTMAPQAELPPRGAVGPKAQRIRGSVKRAIQQLEDGDVKVALETLEMALQKFNQNEV